MTINCKTGENPAQSLEVYPNPTSEDFSFNTSQLNSQGLVKIYDFTGQLHETVTFDHSDITVGKNLPAGIYFAEVEVNNEIISMFKLVKNK